MPADAHEERESRIRSHILPTRVVWHSTGAAMPEGAANLLCDDARTCVLRHQGETPGLLLDFGRELHGGIRLHRARSGGEAPIRVRVRLGESVSEAMGAPDQLHSINDQEVLVPWHGWAAFGETGFRFARLDVLDEGAELELVRFEAVCIWRNLAYQGAFRCNDQRLNHIWETGAHTVHLCMQDLLWDGIKRDRLIWGGGLFPAARVVSSVFGADPLVPKSLDHLRDATPLPGWMNGIGAYSLWWLITHADWYRFHGDEDFLARQREYLVPLLAQICSRIGVDGRENLGGERYLDWTTTGDEAAIHAGLQGLMAWALRAGAELCHVLGETDGQVACQAAANLLRTHTPPPTPSKAANALLALNGLADAKGTNERVLRIDPVQGLSPFGGYFVLEARAQAGDHPGALDAIRAYWGGMLDAGATTFWEHFDPAWTRNAGRIDDMTPAGRQDLHADFGEHCYTGHRRSLCHAWSAGPTAWLTEQVLGLKPVGPGCTAVRVNPNLAGLDWAEGALPTPQGIIRVRHEKTPEGRTKIEVDAPQAVRLLRE